MSELRRDPIIGQWVVFTGAGQKKGQEHIQQNTMTHCPFCPGNEASTPAALLVYRQNSDKSKGWQVRVIPNKFPVLEIEGSIQKQGIGMYDKMNGIGANEIIIEAPGHFRDISELSIDNISNVIRAYKSRILDLRKDNRLKYSLIYRNWGENAGARIDHAHSILVSMPTIPHRIKQEFKGGRQYFEYKERCIFCDIIAQELRARERLIYENDKFIAICPFAARFPYEMWLLPKKHNEDFTTITEEGIYFLSVIMKTLLTKMNLLLNFPPYNYVLHTSSNEGGKNPQEYHWHFEIIPRLSKLSGIEWGAEYFINPVCPEQAAKELNETRLNESY